MNKCEDCDEQLNRNERNFRKMLSGEILTLCEGCAEEFDFNCRQSRDEISEIEDDIIFFSGRDFTSHLR